MTDTVIANRITPAPGSVRSLLEAENYKRRFSDVLGKRAPQFIASLNTLVHASDQLRKCEPITVISAALQAAALDLPIDPNLGFAYIIPYGTKATFQAGWRTYVQLAHRTGQYRNIHVTEVYAGEIKSINRFTGVPTFGERTSDDVAGYMAYFQLTNGFEKYLFMTVDQLQAHGKQYSKTYSRTDSKWKTEFPAMAKKTVVKQLLSKWGPLSIEIQTVLAADVPPDDETGDAALQAELSAEQRARYRAALDQVDDQAPAGNGDASAGAAATQPDNAALDKEIMEREYKG